jgi:hypothetical protein
MCPIPLDEDGRQNLELTRSWHTGLSVMHMRWRKSELTHWVYCHKQWQLICGKGLDMKCPFEVGSAPIDIRCRATGLEVVKVMTKQRAIHANAGFQHYLTSNESWMAYNDTPSRMCMMARSDVDPIARPISHPRKTMMTIFFGDNGSPRSTFAQKKRS